MALSLEYLNKKGYDTSNCIIISSRTCQDILYPIINKLIPFLKNNQSLNILERINSHWHLIHYQKNEDDINCILFESQTNRVAPYLSLGTLIPNNISNFNLYSSNVDIQKADGCGIFTIKFLEYVLKNGPAKILQEIQALSTPVHSSNNSSISKFKFDFPVECMKLTQSLTIINKYNKVLSGKKLQGKENEEIKLMDYVLFERLKYGVKVPANKDGKIQNNLAEYFKSKYLQKSMETIDKNQFDLAKISKIIAQYDGAYYSPVEENGVSMLGDNDLSTTIEN